MKKGKFPTVKVQQNTVQLLAFYPNPRGGKNSAYVIENVLGGWERWKRDRS